jgi:hypothetical protein
MAFTTPGTAVAGEVLTAAFWNTNVRDNTEYLKAEADAVGLVLVNETSWTNQATVTINNVFTSAYLRYVLMFSNLCTSSDSTLFYRHAVGGTPADGSATYLQAGLNANSNSTLSATADSSTRFSLGRCRNDIPATSIMEVSNPAVADRTYVFHRHYDITSSFFFTWGGQHSVSTAYDGIRLFASAGNITGSVKIYGYGQA